MEGRDRIVATILERAEQSRAETEAEAAEKIRAIDAETDEYVAGVQRRTKARAEVLRRETAERASASVKLEEKKLILGAKREALDLAFDRAAERFLALGAKEMCAFLSALLAKYREEGDVVVLSESCREKTAALAKSLSGVEYTSAFSGGMMLKNKRTDKNLTLAALLSEVRESTETKVAKILFERG